MIQAAVISNGLGGLHYYFQSNEKATYHWLEITADFDPDLSGYDLLVVPNGCDHIAMLKAKAKVRAFLEAGKVLFCFDGWFTDWVPGNRWVMDNSKKTIDIRYFKGSDRYGVFDGVDVQALTFSHGISGWWACGYIEPATGAEVLLHDTWGRAMMVLDETTTLGKIVLTASGPLADMTGQTTDDEASEKDLTRLYHNLLMWVVGCQEIQVDATK